jgi:hypothetical protein
MRPGAALAAAPGVRGGSRTGYGGGSLIGLLTELETIVVHLG